MGVEKVDRYLYLGAGEARRDRWRGGRSPGLVPGWLDHAAAVPGGEYVADLYFSERRCENLSLSATRAAGLACCRYTYRSVRQPQFNERSTLCTLRAAKHMPPCWRPHRPDPRTCLPGTCHAFNLPAKSQGAPGRLLPVTKVASLATENGTFVEELLSVFKAQTDDRTDRDECDNGVPAGTVWPLRSA